MTVSNRSRTSRPSIHRRNRDLDVILFIFLFLFVHLEYTKLVNQEDEVLETLEVKEKGYKNAVNTTIIDLDVEEEENAPIGDGFLLDKSGEDKTSTNTSGSSGSSTPSDNSGVPKDTRPSIAVNWNHILQNPNCILIEGSDKPLPLIFMALGRTGSSITWATLAKILGDPEPDKAIEIVGRRQDEATEFFNGIPEQLADSWPSDYICDLQQNFTARALDKGLVGFQWKPYMREFDNPKALSGFRDVASLNERRVNHPKIRIIFQTRNAIDRRLSNWRHRGHGSEVPAHCAIDDEECIREHKKFSQMTNFTTGKELLHWLNQDKKHTNRVLDRLKEMDVDYIHVTYENLYLAEDAEEWMKIFQFLGRGPGSDLAFEQVQESFGMAKTSSKSHKDIMLNYDDVKATLDGTEFEDLLN